MPVANLSRMAFKRRAAVARCTEDAAQLFSEVQNLWETQLGPTHPLVEANLREWAELLRKQGRSDEAKVLSKRADAIEEK